MWIYGKLRAMTYSVHSGEKQAECEEGLFGGGGRNNRWKMTNTLFVILQFIIIKSMRLNINKQASRRPNLAGE